MNVYLCCGVINLPIVKLVIIPILSKLDFIVSHVGRYFMTLIIFLTVFHASRERNVESR